MTATHLDNIFIWWIAFHHSACTVCNCDIIMRSYCTQLIQSILLSFAWLCKMCRNGNPSSLLFSVVMWQLDSVGLCIVGLYVHTWSSIHVWRIVQRLLIDWQCLFSVGVAPGLMMALGDEACLLSSIDDSYMLVLVAAFFMTWSMKYF